MKKISIILLVLILPLLLQCNQQDSELVEKCRYQLLNNFESSIFNVLPLGLLKNEIYNDFLINEYKIAKSLGIKMAIIISLKKSEQNKLLLKKIFKKTINEKLKIAILMNLMNNYSNNVLPESTVRKVLYDVINDIDRKYLIYDGYRIDIYSVFLLYNKRYSNNDYSKMIAERFMKTRLEMELFFIANYFRVLNHNDFNKQIIKKYDSITDNPGASQVFLLKSISSNMGYKAKTIDFLKQIVKKNEEYVTNVKYQNSYEDYILSKVVEWYCAMLKLDKFLPEDAIILKRISKSTNLMLKANLSQYRLAEKIIVKEPLEYINNIIEVIIRKGYNKKSLFFVEALYKYEKGYPMITKVVHKLFAEKDEDVIFAILKKRKLKKGEIGMVKFLLDSKQNKVKTKVAYRILQAINGIVSVTNRGFVKFGYYNY